jgi:hypothetical protein
VTSTSSPQGRGLRLEGLSGPLYMMGVSLLWLSRGGVLLVWVCKVACQVWGAAVVCRCGVGVNG